MDELIQTIIGSKPSFDWSISWNFWDGVEGIKIAKAAIIFVVSRSSLFSSLTKVIQIHECTSIRNG